MMRAKRPRLLHGASQSHGNGHSGHSRTRSMSEENLGDDHLLNMDPSLMTERQQLAFLLRKTAQEQSGADSPTTHSSESSDDGGSYAKRPKKRIQRKTSPRNVRKAAAANDHQAKALPSTPRGRSPKNASKPIGNEATAPTIKNATRPTKLSAKRLHVKTTSPTASDVEVFSPEVLTLSTKASIRKPSPSSTSDITHIGVFDEALGHTEFWSSHCALCSASASHLDASCEPLFLCQSCDQKYPTQRALGRV